MLDKTIQIKKDNHIICTLGSKNILGYDNFIWCQLGLLVNIINRGFKNVEDLFKEIEEKTYFVKMENEGEAELTLDLDNLTIDMPYFSIYKPSEVNKENCCIGLKKVDDEYYSIYEDDEEYLMNKVTFNDINLLNKKKVTLDEFSKIEEFVDGLIEEYNDTDFVLNNELIIRFNFA